jgi:hypothetical protein
VKTTVTEEFPSNGPNAVPVAQIAELLRKVFLHNEIDNFLALRASAMSESDSSSAEDASDTEDDSDYASDGDIQLPLCHSMVGRLLQALFAQPVREAKSTLLEVMRPTMPRECTVVCIAYAISLVSYLTRFHVKAFNQFFILTADR